MESTKGFTLIELVMTVIIIGILAIISIPRFFDLSHEARLAVLNSIAASLSASNAVNYVSRKDNSALGIPITNCTNLATILQNGLPPNYSIQPLAVGADTSVNCTLQGSNSLTTTFTATGIA